MGNLNYQRSRKKEYQVLNQLKEEGYLAFRTAGSHGIADVIGIKPRKCGDANHYFVRFIQIKVSEKIKEEKTRIDICKAPFGLVNVEFQFFPVKSENYYDKYRKAKAKKRTILSPVGSRSKRLEIRPHQLRRTQKAISR